TTTTRLVPVDVAGLSANVVAISTGSNHACAVTQEGAVKCWGQNGSGQLGDGSTTSRLVPVDVVGLSSGVVKIALGFRHTCAITAAGGVKCWGTNGAGQLGDNWGESYSSVPVDVIGLPSKAIAIAAAFAHTCALLEGGAVECWGWNLHGELGNGSAEDTSPVPVDVVGLSSGIVGLAAGTENTCAITAA